MYIYICVYEDLGAEIIAQRRGSGGFRFPLRQRCVFAELPRGLWAHPYAWAVYRVATV